MKRKADHSLLDLPDELLVLILSQYADDVYRLLNLSNVCRSFQRIIKSFVLAVGDSKTQSENFKMITGSYVHMSGPKDVALLKRVAPKYSVLILEFSGLGEATSSDAYVCTIASVSAKVRQPIIEVFLTKKAAMISLEPVHYDELQLELLSHVSTTLFLNDSEDALLGMIYDEIMRMGHTYHFNKTESLPRFTFLNSEAYPCKFMSNSLTTLKGVVNASMSSERVMHLIKFFELSDMPNLKVISGVAIESGTSLDMFQKFPLLKELELVSVYAGNDTLFNSTTTSLTFPLLTKLSISGNSLSLSNLSLPMLDELKLEIHGNRDREDEETSVRLECVDLPKLKKLMIYLTMLPNGLDYLLNTALSSSLNELETLSVQSNAQSFIDVNNRINGMKSLTDVTFKYNNFEDNITDTSFMLEPLPHLRKLTLGKFDNSILRQRYEMLEELQMTVRITNEEQRYVFNSTTYPKLKVIKIEYHNSFAHLRDCNIFLELDLSELEVVFTNQPLPMTNVEFIQPPKSLDVYLVE